MKGSEPGRRYSLRTILLVVGYLLLAAGIAPFVLRQVHANDLFKALYTGRYLSLFGQFPHHSAFTFSPVVEHLPRDVYTGLGNLMLFGVHQLGGITALQLLRAGIAIGALVFLHARSRFSAHPLAFLVLFFVLVGISQKLRLRTAIVAVPFTLILLYLYTEYDLQNDRRYLWAIPVLFAVWGNMHGSYLIGFGFFAALMLGEVLQRGYRLLTSNAVDGQAVLSIGLVFALTVTALTVVKPAPDTKVLGTAMDLPTRLMDTENDPGERPAPGGQARPEPDGPSWYDRAYETIRQAIAPARGFRSSEFASPLAHVEYAFVKANAVVLIIGLVAFVLFGLSVRYVPLVIATVILGSAYLRSIPYIALVFGSLLFAHGRYYTSRLGRFGKTVASIGSLSALIGLVAGLQVAVLTGGLSSVTNQRYHAVGFGTAEKFSSDAARYVRERYPEERVGNSFNIGGFLIWKWWPDKRVLFDSKTSAYPPSFWRRLRRTGLLRHFRTSNISTFILERGNPNAALLTKASNWHVQYRTRGVLVFERRRLHNNAVKK